MWELDHKDSWAAKNWCLWIVVLEKTLESLLDCKEIKPVHPKGKQSWIFTGRTDAKAETLATWYKELTNWKRSWCCERLKTGGEGAYRGSDGWMASPTPWTWVWINSRSWRWTGRPGLLQSTESQRVGHDWVTELNWTEYVNYWISKLQSLSSLFIRKNILHSCLVNTNKWYWTLPGEVKTKSKTT